MSNYILVVSRAFMVNGSAIHLFSTSLVMVTIFQTSYMAFVDYPDVIPVFAC